MLDFTGLGDFTIHTLSLLITKSLFCTFPIHSLQLHSATSWFTLCRSWSHTNFTYCSTGFLYRCLLPIACCLLSVVWVNSGVACYVTVGSAAMSPRWGEGWSVDLPVTVAAAALGCYVIAGGRGGALHSGNTSQYILIISDTLVLFATRTIHISEASEVMFYCVEPFYWYYCFI
jgi:hypothetical protein